MNLRKGTAIGICLLAAVAACKKKSEDQGNAAGSTPVPPAAAGDLDPGAAAEAPAAVDGARLPGEAPAPRGTVAIGGAPTQATASPSQVRFGADRFRRRRPRGQRTRRGGSQGCRGRATRSVDTGWKGRGRPARRIERSQALCRSR